MVTAEPPLPEGGAVGRCAVGLLRGLMSHGVEVRALAARQFYAVPGDPPPDLPVEVVAVPPDAAGWRSRLRRLRRPLGALARDGFQRRLVEAAGVADVVHLEDTQTSWCVEGVESPSVLHMHHLVLEDRSLGWPWQKQFREVWEPALCDRMAVRRHRRLVANSPRVADWIRKTAPRADVVVVPLSLDPCYYPPAPLDGPPTAGIIGTAAWVPTATAVRRLLTRVWPLVRQRVPDARLVLAGRGMDRFRDAGSPGGVEITGEVGSASEFLRGLSVLLYPLERGTGMKVKVLESIASGLPVVTTPPGAEGIEADGGVVVHSDDRLLAEGAAGILLDERERRERGTAARVAFMRRYAPAPATEPLVELYGRTAGA